MMKTILDWNAKRPEPSASNEWTPALTILGGADVGSQTKPDIQPAAAGDLPCKGYCAEGGTRGTTGAYILGGRPVCRNCAVKLLGIGNEPSSEQNKTLRRFELQSK